MVGEHLRDILQRIGDKGQAAVQHLGGPGVGDDVFQPRNRVDVRQIGIDKARFLSGQIEGRTGMDHGPHILLNPSLQPGKQGVQTAGFGQCDKALHIHRSAPYHGQFTRETGQ
jgi:hypothetical protein